jgi:REP element-mobilizing transposase RayT
MNRGAQKRHIFRNDRDYLSFLGLLGEACNMWKVEVHAYCLMPNHYHLLLHTPHGNLSRAMRHISGVYTQRFNLKWGRDAQLFRGRFKAILVEEDNYLDELVRYIHLNALKAKLVDAAEKYPWSSYPYFLGRSDKPVCLVTDYILQRYGRRLNKARRELVVFTAAGVPEELQKVLDGKKWPAILSGELYSEWIKRNYIPKVRDREVIYPRRDVSRLTLKQIIGAICAVADKSWPTIKAARRGKDLKWRKFAVLALRRELGLTYEKIARSVGGMHPSQISRLIHCERHDLERDHEWQHIIAELQAAKVKT